MASGNHAIKSSNFLPTTSVNRALNFNRDYSLLKNYYETWAADYDNDVSEENYCGPSILSDLFESLIKKTNFTTAELRPPLRIMDACCGTGLVGKQLAQRGFQAIDGCDLSPAMTDLARQTQAYKALYGGVDLTDTNVLIAENSYDATLCCGAFIEGHLPVEAIHELIRITSTNGLLLFSTRCTFYETEHFEELLTNLVSSKHLTPLPSLMNAPYLDNVHANYLAFEVTK
ncbi:MULTISPECIES: class I SAM-dependent methyltransferase [Pseudomonas]|uniref:class I SAM-dependent DNA methyltransferase n=1 Tax=Pseudomonas TaxID=286 RepID=UPI000B354455|nr:MULTISPECIES: class I SAM-dependent methyltransferase [Pseudomonas]PMY64057.1 magnesium protoporphyrin IX methyltransferase [Pseudomonas sp. FW305-25]PMY68008.1 magnesium protoporphyrin IX methyltransferase [Pseudomonas sp. FW126-L8]PNA79356.1 magnesium protoporphyrin IX methyltransferase [Pseudomonas sp. FW305-76]